MTVVLYVQNLTEPINRVLQLVGVGEPVKPVCVLSDIFCKPKYKVLDKKSRALLIKYLVVNAMWCTSVKQAEA